MRPRALAWRVRVVEELEVAVVALALSQSFLKGSRVDYTHIYIGMESATTLKHMGRVLRARLEHPRTRTHDTQMCPRPIVYSARTAAHAILPARPLVSRLPPIRTRALLPSVSSACGDLGRDGDRCLDDVCVFARIRTGRVCACQHAFWSYARTYLFFIDFIAFAAPAQVHNNKHLLVCMTQTDRRVTDACRCVVASLLSVHSRGASKTSVHTT